MEAKNHANIFLSAVLLAYSYSMQREDAASEGLVLTSWPIPLQTIPRTSRKPQERLSLLPLGAQPPGSSVPFARSALGRLSAQLRSERAPGHLNSRTHYEPVVLSCLVCEYVTLNDDHARQASAIAQCG